MIGRIDRAVPCFVAIWFATGAALAESPTPESQMTFAMLSEVRQLRQDLQVVAGVIQRVQILMFRLQIQGRLLEDAKQRQEQAAHGCGFLSQQRETMRTQITEVEINKRNAQNSAEQRAADGRFLELTRN